MNIQEAEFLQTQLSEKIINFDCFTYPIKVIAGCDVEYSNKSNLITGAMVLFDNEKKDIIEFATHTMEADFPYIPGLFSFREMPSLIKSFEKLVKKPDLIICDSQGVAHPRGLGLASHLGIELDIATIGCAKSLLYGKYVSPPVERGSYSDIIDEKNEKVIGRVLRTQTGIKPLFVSIGHKISLSTASEIVLSFCMKYRLPETTRMADFIARQNSTL